MEPKILNGLEPKIIWELFEEISRIPRESKKEEKIRAWVKAWANKHKVPIKEDEVGNILLTKEASRGCEHYPGVILQAHLDMVAQKEPSCDHDFDNDPIPLKIVDDYVTAEGTTLGADNGIGIAMCLAAMIDPYLENGPIEVLLTVDEETGLTGAFGLEFSFINHKLLLNLDSENEGEITISSAGGGDTEIILPVTWHHKSYYGFNLTVNGLTGGHSGVDIHKDRFNAIKILIEGLINIRQQVDFHICSINGGSAHNAIPREASCDFLVDDKEITKGVLEEWNGQIKTYRKSEPKLEVKLSEASLETCMSSQSSSAIITLLYEIPHGPLSFSKEIPDLVETSNNLAKVKTTATQIEVVASTRSSVNEELNRVRSELKELGERVGGNVSQGSAYPGWQPELDSPFLKLVQQEYTREYNKEVKLMAIHAGLETGLFKGINPELQLVSIGPEIKDPHSPQERVYIKSVDLIWRIVKAVLAKLDQL